MAQEDDALAQMLVDDKIRGKSYLEIAEKHGIPVEDVISILRGVYLQTQIKDPTEYRALLQLRIERIIDKLWNGLESGSFKHGEAILKAVTSLQEMHDLNEKTIRHEISIISDEETAKLLEVMKHTTDDLYQRVLSVPLNKQARAALEAWPEWAAEATTNAVEESLIEIVEVDD
jgi:hypothetical protein